MDILELKNNIKNQNNFTGFKDCTDIKDSKAEQINVNRWKSKYNLFFK